MSLVVVPSPSWPLELYPQATTQAGSVVLDLSRMNEVTGLDLVSRVVDVQAGVRGGQLEDALAAEGLTVGHYPQSAASSTVGGWIAASSAGQASAGFGATEATLACQVRPAGWRWLAFGFDPFTALADGLREVVRAQTGAAAIRGYDETDAALSFGTLGHPGGCVALLGFPADLAALQARMSLADEVMHRAGAADLDVSYGEHWQQHRNDAVGLYQQVMGSCAAAGGTITHHRGVGRLKSAFLAADLGPAGADVLRRIKAALDLDGILNPGALLP